MHLLIHKQFLALQMFKFATVEPASGGAEAESTQSIKFNAPLDYASQGRCVTAEDYKVFVKRFFLIHKQYLFLVVKVVLLIPVLGVSSVQEFGKVFISIKSTTGNNLTVTEKITISS